MREGAAQPSVRLLPLGLLGSDINFGVMVRYGSAARRRNRQPPGGARRLSVSAVRPEHHAFAGHVTRGDRHGRSRSARLTSNRAPAPRPCAPAPRGRGGPRRGPRRRPGGRGRATAASSPSAAIAWIVSWTRCGSSLVSVWRNHCSACRSPRRARAARAACRTSGLGSRRASCSVSSTSGRCIGSHQPRLLDRGGPVRRVPVAARQQQTALRSAGTDARAALAGWPGTARRPGPTAARGGYVRAPALRSPDHRHPLQRPFAQHRPDARIASTRSAPPAPARRADSAAAPAAAAPPRPPRPAGRPGRSRISC